MTRSIIYRAVLGLMCAAVAMPSAFGQSKLTSPAWQEFRNTARQYDSLQMAIKKMQEEDPELILNQAKIQERLKDRMQEIVGIFQSYAMKAQQAMQEKVDISAYDIDDLRLVRQAALSVNDFETTLAVVDRLLALVTTADSLRDLRVERIQFMAMTGRISDAAAIASDELLASAKSIIKAQLYSMFASGFAEEGKLDDARRFALKGVSAVNAYRSETMKNLNAVKDPNVRATQNDQLDQFFFRQYAGLLAPVVAQLGATKDSVLVDPFLEAARGEIASDSTWTNVKRLLDQELDRVNQENQAVNGPAKSWAEHVWLGSEPLSLESLRGKVILVDFFATWCRPCIMAFPHIREWQTKYKESGLVIVGLTNYQGRYEGKSASQNDEVKKLRDDFIPKHKVAWPVGIEKNGRQTFSDYGVSGIPHVVLIDRKGKLRYQKTGAADYEQTERWIKRLLAEE